MLPPALDFPPSMTFKEACHNWQFGAILVLSNNKQMYVLDEDAAVWLWSEQEFDGPLLLSGELLLSGQWRFVKKKVGARKEDLRLEGSRVFFEKGIT